MGFAIADEAVRRGAEVTVVAANVELPRIDAVTYVDVETAAELLEATRAAFAAADVLVMSAAVADFRPASPVADKISKSGMEGMKLELEPTDDVLVDLAGERRPNQVVVGFAAEHGAEGVDRARGKLERKRLDAVVVNDISRSDIGFDSDENEVTRVFILVLRRGGGSESVPRASKAEVAGRILDTLERLRAERARAGQGQRA